MKVCSYCGKENPDEAVFCCGCGTELPVPPPPEISPGKNLRPQYIDFAGLVDVVKIVEGYPYPDWRRIWHYLKQNVREEQLAAAWREAALQWLERFRLALGEIFFLDEADSFFMVSCQNRDEREGLLKFIGRAIESIRERLQGVRLPKTYGKQVVIIFNSDEDFYRYVSFFYPEGNFNRSSGIFLRDGYGHIAVPVFDKHSISWILAHELAHNAIFTLPIPRWLNEGVAQIFESQVMNQRGTGFDGDMDLVGRHREHWTSITIQDYWSGRAFLSPETDELSYSLANIMINLIANERGDFKAFLQNARYQDGGAEAFIQTYGKSLGQIAEIFLGEGDWEPKPEVIHSQFDRKAPEKD